MILGLDAMHQKRVLHRDLKPLNVLLTESLDAKLGDLGVAKVGSLEGEAAVVEWVGAVPAAT